MWIRFVCVRIGSGEQSCEKERDGISQERQHYRCTKPTRTYRLVPASWALPVGRFQRIAQTCLKHVRHRNYLSND